MPTTHRMFSRPRQSAIAARPSSRSVPIVIMRTTPATRARSITSSNWLDNRGSVKWQWVSITATAISKCPLKRAGRVPDDRGLAVGPDDRDHVESRRGLGEAVAGEEELGGLGDLVLL